MKGLENFKNEDREKSDVVPDDTLNADGSICEHPFKVRGYIEGKLGEYDSANYYKKEIARLEEQKNNKK